MDADLFKQYLGCALMGLLAGDADETDSEIIDHAVYLAKMAATRALAEIHGLPKYPQE